jgi:hypothetical protein
MNHDHVPVRLVGEAAAIAHQIDETNEFFNNEINRLLTTASMLKLQRDAKVHDLFRHLRAALGLDDESYCLLDTRYKSLGYMFALISPPPQEEMTDMAKLFSQLMDGRLN